MSEGIQSARYLASADPTQFVQSDFGFGPKPAPAPEAPHGDDAGNESDSAESGGHANPPRLRIGGYQPCHDTENSGQAGTDTRTHEHPSAGLQAAEHQPRLPSGQSERRKRRRTLYGTRKHIPEACTDGQQQQCQQRPHD